MENEVWLALHLGFSLQVKGVKPDGKTDSTKSLISAWAAACGSPRPATIYVPPGRYLVQQVHFRGACQNKAITIRIDGTLVAPSDYNALRSVGNWILFEGVNGVAISGGILDGQGGLWACKASSKLCPSGATFCPPKYAARSKYLPGGTYIVAGFAKAQAEAHAVRNALVESVLPSGFAPIVIVAANDDEQKKIKTLPNHSQ
ncbi:hypothetical protein RJ640_018082 [Escallonia rubra]|uniref:Polygalacturonase n=1 Tax=Escallonia rubra TaxID=112253 RepID=A0AA88QUC0_9ASTE|nr:hypothetical protein RJ640_018082 [Escallonia rubra]